MTLLEKLQSFIEGATPSPLLDLLRECEEYVAACESAQPIGEIDASDDDGYFVELYPDRSFKVGNEVYLHPSPPLAKCPYCDGTGDVHRADGEWLGVCSCTESSPPPAGMKLLQEMEPSYESNGDSDDLLIRDGYIMGWNECLQAVKAARGES